MAHSIPIPQFTGVREISNNIYELSVDLTGVNASRAALTFNLAEPRYVYMSVNVTDIKPTFASQMFYSIYLQHEARVQTMNDDNTYTCTAADAANNCSTANTTAGGGATLFFSMYGTSPAISMQFRAELNMRTKNTLNAPILISKGPAFLSGVGLFDKLKGGSSPPVPRERQGVGLECEMMLKTASDPKFISWESIAFSFENNETAIAGPIQNNDALAALVLVPVGIIAGVVGFFVWRRFRKDAKLKKHASVLATVSAEMIEQSPLVGLPRIYSSDLTTMQTLGTGSFGSVRLATYKGEFVAVKQLNDSKSQEQLDALMREAEVMATLRKCKNIVKLLGVCSDSTGSAIVMEFCPRGSLSNYLKRRLALSEYEIFKLAFSIMSGMVVLETAEIVHRDLAARNVLLDEHGFAKVSDFGYSRSASNKATGKEDDKNSLGPVKWQAPEVLRALATGSAQETVELTSASDVWSFGCTLVEIVTGKEPYHGYRGSIIQLATEIANAALNPLSFVQENAPNTPIPEWLLPIIRNCFGNKALERATFRELRYQMVKAARDLHNQYENEVDQADSLLSVDGYYSHVPQNAPSAAGWSSATASQKLSSGRELFSPAHAEASNKVDLSHVERLNKLGEGSFGAVFLGISQGTYVAIKELSVTASPDDVRREAGVMTAIQQHRNIVQLYGLISSSDQLQIVMEFAPKGSLESFLKAAQAGQARVTEGLQFKWAVGIARGMQALAASKVVHRDLASRNILLDSTLEPKISDFGMSRTVLDPNQESSTRSDVGPIRWFAPECLEMKYSEKSDVWAYGCTLLEIITGEIPFPHLKIMDAAVAIREGRTPIEGLQQVAHLVPEWLTKSLEMCFKYDPKDRPSFAELVSFLEKQGSSIQEVREAEEEIQKRRQRRTLNLRDQNKIKNVSSAN